MWKKVEIEVDSDLVQEAISRYLLGSRPRGRPSRAADLEYDEFSDISAWQPRRRHETG